jgi:hypothetical protein
MSSDVEGGDVGEEGVVDLADGVALEAARDLFLGEARLVRLSTWARGRGACALSWRNGCGAGQVRQGSFRA